MQRPAFPPIRAQAPAAQRPRYGVYQQGQDWRQHWRRPGALPGYTRLPSTLPANAAWPQQRIRQSPDAALPAPQIIYAPQAASGPAEPPLDFTHGEPPLDYAYAEPCAAPLLIHIGAPAQAPAGVRVVHAQASPCGAPQAVVYRGPKIVRIEPQAGVRTVGRTSAHRHAAKPAQRGFKVVRVRK